MFVSETKTKEWEKEYGFTSSLFAYEDGYQRLVYENPSLVREG